MTACHIYDRYMNDMVYISVHLYRLYEKGEFISVSRGLSNEIPMIYQCKLYYELFEGNPLVVENVWKASI